MITKFSGDYDFLSNYYPCDVMLGGVLYPSVENAFQAAKTLDLEARKAFLSIGPNEAKKLGQKVELRPNWDKIKVFIMWCLLINKFEKEPLKSKLLQTDDKFLVEGNWWKDDFWGVCTADGKNWLGYLLMQVRSTLCFEKEMNDGNN